MIGVVEIDGGEDHDWPIKLMVIGEWWVSRGMEVILLTQWEVRGRPETDWLVLLDRRTCPGVGELR